MSSSLAIKTSDLKKQNETSELIVIVPLKTYICFFLSPRSIKYIKISSITVFYLFFLNFYSQIVL